MQRKCLKKCLSFILFFLLVCYLFLVFTWEIKAVSVEEEIQNAEEVVPEAERIQEAGSEIEAVEGSVQQTPTELEKPQGNKSMEKRDQQTEVEGQCRLSYQVCIQGKWGQSVSDGQKAGTTGQSKQMEAVRIKVQDATGKTVSSALEYEVHVQDIGWMSGVKDGNVAGTVGKGKQMEAIRIRLTGDMKEKYDIYYRVHSSCYGNLGWAKNGENAGTQSYGKGVEAIWICLVEKESSEHPIQDSPSFLSPTDKGSITYASHVQNIGWMDSVANGAVCGTQGKALRMEALRIYLNNPIDEETGEKIEGSIRYQAHVQNFGWMAEVQEGRIAGTTGKGKRVEAIRMELTGDIEEKYDIYYQVHVQNYGWLGWAKNGQVAGSSGCAYRMEALRILLQPKTDPAPGDNSNYFRGVLGVEHISQYAAGAPMGCEAASLLQALHYKGYAKKYDLSNFLKEMPLAADQNPNNGFAGSPYKVESGVYQSIYPKPLANWGKKYGDVKDISGASVKKLKEEIQKGNPVVVYVTGNFETTPKYAQYHWGVGLDNAHIVVLDGFKDGKYHIVDPASSRGDCYWISEKVFEKVYNFQKFAVVVR